MNKNTKTVFLSASGHNASQPPTKSVYILFAIISHTVWGAYPVLARYLQNIHHISTMSLSAMTNILAAIALVLFMSRNINLKAIGPWEFLAYAFIIVARGALNLYAAKLTYATNVQLFALLAPFIVAMLSKTFLKEPLPRYTFLALCFSLGGSLLMIFDVSKRSYAAILGSGSSWIGIGLAILGSIFLAFLMLAIKLAAKKGASAETLAFAQFGALSICMTPGSIIAGENWKPWLSLPLPGIAAYLAFAVVVLLIGTILQNNSIKALGAAVYSTIQAWRLTSTIVFSWIMLGESITSFWQGFGAFVVMVTVTLYMFSQKKERGKNNGAPFWSIDE